MSLSRQKKLYSLTKLEQEQQSKQLAGEIDEELSVTGQESEAQAVKWVQEIGKEERHTESEQLAEAEWKATDVKKKIFTYRDVILQEMKRQMVDAHDVLPYNFIWYPLKDEKQGLIIWIRDPKGKWYARGMHICMVPKYDIQCVSRLIEKALNHMDDLEQAYEAEEREAERFKKTVQKSL